MLNPEHIEIVKQGSDAIRRWREANAGVQLDLSGADLTGANLHDANLHGANLHGADLSVANLSGANLHGANLHVANLTGANLHGADLIGANLHGAVLRAADLSGANLSAANVLGADLSGVNLHGADLSNASVSYVTFANLDHVQLSGSNLGRVAFANLDLAEATLDGVTHSAPSTMGTDTLAKSAGKIPDEFLRGCGLAPWEVLNAKLYDQGLSANEVVELQYRIFSERTKSAFSINGVFISYFMGQRRRRLQRQQVRREATQRTVRSWPQRVA